MTRWRLLPLVLLVSFVAALVPTKAHAQMTGTPAPGYRREPGVAASAVPAPLREIGFEQNIDQPLPLDAPFRDEHGRDVRLGDFFGTRPVVLAFVYYDCPMLCLQVINAMAGTIGVLSLDAGRDFDIVLISIDPREGPEQAAAKKAMFLERYERPTAASGVHFLTGTEAAIARVAAAAGFRYAWDEPTEQYAHPAGIIVVTPDGRPARYLFGLEYSPRDLRFALLEASEGRVGSKVDALLLYCFHYDPMTGRYGVVVMQVLRIAGVATVLAIAGFIVVMTRRERRSTLKNAPSTLGRTPSPLNDPPSTVGRSTSTLSSPPSTPGNSFR
jgi:protein SCO1/2